MLWETLVRRSIPWTALEEEERRLVAQVQAGETGRMLLSEPTPTFTRGRSAAEGDLLWDDDECRRRGIAVHAAVRGGKWTYHGPGQLLLYPIVALEALGYDRRAVRAFVSRFREGTARFLESLGLEVERRDEPFGLYVGRRKIASFGVAVERGVSRHGVALYLRSQEELFRGIVPCGTPGETFTSLEEWGTLISWEEAAEGLAGHVKRVFNQYKS